MVASIDNTEIPNGAIPTIQESVAGMRKLLDELERLLEVNAEKG